MGFYIIDFDLNFSRDLQVQLGNLDLLVLPADGWEFYLNITFTHHMGFYDFCIYNLKPFKFAYLYVLNWS